MELLLQDAAGLAGLTSAQVAYFVAQIGNTPLYPLKVVIEGRIRTISLKLEGANPSGSVKDRTGSALIQDLERRQLIKSDSIVLESTSGNLGVALALVCRARGYRFLAVVDPKTTEENLAKMRALGAQIDLVTRSDVNGGYLLSRLERIEELCQSSERYIWTDQYANPANPRMHAETTGPEIYGQMDGKVGAVFVAVSTGGTLAGIGEFFRVASPSTRLIGVDARGSVVFGSAPAARKLTGIGSSRPSRFLSPANYDVHVLVSDEEAFAWCRALQVAVDLKVGGSSGAVLSACVRYMREQPEVRDVVCVCSDSGENYRSTIFNDHWLDEQGLQVTRSHQELLRAILRTDLPWHN